MKPLQPVNIANNAPRRRQRRDQELVFAPLAWLKLQFCCHAGDTEISGMGISAEHDPLYIEEFALIKQQATWAHVALDADALADFQMEQATRGLSPSRFARIWCHTHPGKSVTPSSEDEETFATQFLTGPSWGLMFILGRTALTYARLSFSAGPGGSVLLPTRVDWARWPAEFNHMTAGLVRRWCEEYETLVQIVHPTTGCNVWPESKPVESLSSSPVDNLPAVVLREAWEDEAWWQEYDRQWDERQEPLTPEDELSYAELSYAELWEDQQERLHE